MSGESCFFCGESEFVRGIKQKTYRYKDEAIVVDQPGAYCSACGEGVLEASDMKAVQKEIHDMHAKGDGFLISSEVKRIRGKLNLIQRDAGEIFGGGVNAFSRYERGEAMQPRATDKWLRLLDRNTSLLDALICDSSESHPGMGLSTGWSDYSSGQARVSVTFSASTCGNLVLHETDNGDRCRNDLADLPLAA